MSAIITRQFEQWCAERTANNLPARPDTFIFAYVPGQDPDGEMDRDEPLPPEDQVMHRAPVAQYGTINNDAVAYSVVLDTKVGDFDYNWIGLLDAESDTLCMIVHTRTQKKIATNGPFQGNTLSRTLVMEFNGAAAASHITVTAATWQIDFSARIFGQDDQLRLANLETYGQGSFFDNGFLVIREGNSYSAMAGRGYVGGIRAELTGYYPITVTTKPTFIWADVSWQGATTSAWSAHVVLTAAENLVDYIDPQRFPHYVTAIARIEADGSVTDLRPKGSQGEQEANRLFLRKDQNLGDVKNKATSRENLDVYSKSETDGRYVNQSGDIMAGPLTSTFSDTYRIVSGRYGTFWRNDGSALYLMLTNPNDQQGNFNALRPFTVNLESGRVSIANGLLLGGDWPALQMSTGTTFHPDGNIEGSTWGGFLSNWLNDRFTSVNNNIDTRATKDYVNATFVKQLRLGANVYFGGYDGTVMAPSGYVVTGLGDFGAADGYGYAAPLQYLINGNWITMGVA
ncbi:phage tail protein [Serratia sp. JSRIV002]|uniref:phage tail-collar fiber domain-containing protein n=1 Tax=Serratia sp. JSRIV002 TaxID=2831894 RepID=UPI001CBFF7DE|nr:phage tail protein [Serratia sp. JSRIV002]UAN53705.1 phage tail protein [Serratia sp. JSRIV002]